MLTVQVPESVWINPWVKPAPEPAAKEAVNEIYTGCNAEHTHSFVTEGNSTTTTELWWKKHKEGITPMSYGLKVNASPSAVASISVPSDEQKKVDYLNSRAQSVYYDIERTFRDMFHMNGPSQPRYYKELIDAIKNGDYEIDEKQAKYADEAWEDFQDNDDGYFDYNAFYGINFTKFPKADYKGRDAAYKELRAEFQRVKDIIAIMPAEEALSAVQAFEKWQPSNAPTKQ